MSGKFNVTYVSLHGGAVCQAEVEEYEPGFAEGKDMLSWRDVVLLWDGDEWIEVKECERCEGVGWVDDPTACEDPEHCSPQYPCPESGCVHSGE